MFWLSSLLFSIGLGWWLALTLVVFSCNFLNDYPDNNSSEVF
jgi:hypothetical protein